MLCWDTEIADISKGVLAFASGQELVQLRRVRVLGWDCGLLGLNRLCDGCLEVLDWIRTSVELLSRLLFL